MAAFSAPSSAITKRFQDALAKATHVASGAEQGVEVRIREETHDSSRRYRCVDSVRAFAGAVYATDDDDLHLDNNLDNTQWHEKHKFVSIRGNGKCSVSISLK